MDGYNSDEDCDDTDPAINPGATEVCDGMDNNCSGTADDGLPIYTYFQDADSDGHGNPQQFYTTCQIIPDPGFVANSNDCDDTNPDINPDATEIPYNGFDDDCDAATLDDDLDQDGYLHTDDCDDTNAKRQSRCHRNTQ